MAMIIRFRQQGKNKRHSFRLVVADRRSPRDGKYVEKLGLYDPFVLENNFTMDTDRVKFWLEQGALCSDKAMVMIKKKAPEMIRDLMRKKEVKAAPKAEEIKESKPIKEVKKTKAVKAKKTK
jgi:small subunit ribosomal protein S16